MELILWSLLRSPQIRSSKELNLHAAVTIRHPDKVRKVVSISAVFRQSSWTKETLDAFPQLTAEAFKGTPIEADYKRLSPTPNEFSNFVNSIVT